MTYKSGASVTKSIFGFAGYGDATRINQRLSKLVDGTVANTITMLPGIGMVVQASHASTRASQRPTLPFRPVADASFMQLLFDRSQQCRYAYRLAIL